MSGAPAIDVHQPLSGSARCASQGCVARRPGCVPRDELWDRAGGGGGESKRGEAEVQRGAGPIGGIGGVASGAEGAFDSEGNYTLELPYRDDRELVLDILRQGEIQ